MPILKNKFLEISVDLPLEGYQASRFDWTGKITEVKFQNIPVSAKETLENFNVKTHGQGFYNEFGFDEPIGFSDCKIGGWFHKIGIGLLKKEDKAYHFSKTFQIKPATFEVEIEADKIKIVCIGENESGYGYRLQKEIKLHEVGFSINYDLTNTGEKTIITNEYTHNFLGSQNGLIGKQNQLDFPFQIQPSKFIETINPEKNVILGHKMVNFRTHPNLPFFFSNLSGSEIAKATWEFTDQKIKISEICNFNSNKFNLWGWKHVVSPEMYFDIEILPNKNLKWCRLYQFENLK